MILLLISLVFSYESVAKKDNPYKLEAVLKENDIIWGFDFLDENNVVLSLKKGELKKVNIKSKKNLASFKVPHLSASGQGGLLDIKKHYDFSKKPYIYFSYSKEKEGKKTTALARIKLENNSFKDFEILYEAKPYFSETKHFGSRLVFDKKGHIYFSVGDRGNRDLSQKLNTANGKIHRIKENGDIPKDNPFYNKKGAVKSIWSYGHRNPQGLYYIESKEEVWEQEHGPRGGDEINKIAKSKNYGWPVVTFGKEYWGPSIGEGISKKGMEDPLYHFTPSIAPSGFLYYEGDYYNDWKGHFLSGALKLQHLNLVKWDGKKISNEKRYFEEAGERIRALRQGPKGFIYASSDSGYLYKILKVKH